MPTISDHLEWVELSDFSKGLWTTGNSFTMPGDAFQTMTDCHPQPGGGLRAWYKSSNITDTGLPSSGWRPISLHRQLRASGGVVLEELLLGMQSTDGSTVRMYHRDLGASTWTLAKTFAAASGGAQSTVQITNYQITGGNLVWVVSHFSFGGTSSADDGIWTFDPTGPTWTKINSSLTNPITVYQSRILATIGSQVWWTDPGTTTFSAANYLDMADYGVRDISNVPAWLASQGPSTLLVMTAGSGIFSIEGSLDDPVVREMGGHHYGTESHRYPVVGTDDGVIFMQEERGIWIAQNMGSTYDRLDPQLTPIDWSPSSMFMAPTGFAYLDPYLFTPMGRVMDYRTGCWFIDSQMEADNTQSFFDSKTIGCYTLPYEENPTLRRYQLYERTASRCSTYTVKTAPLRRPDGYQMVVREVQVMVKGFHADDQVAVTVNGTTRTLSSIGTGTNVLVFPFNERGEYLDVQVVPTSGNSGEAPAIEVIRVGVRPDGHRLR